VVLGRRKNSQVFPDLTLDSVWEAYTNEPFNRSDEYHWTAFKNLQYFKKDTREEILSDLMQVETDSMRQNDRLRYIREKIMTLVDRRISAVNKRRLTDHVDGRQDRIKVSYESKREHAMAACGLQIAILRAYARGKYGDARQDDWYAMYTYLSKSFHNQKFAGQTGDAGRRFVFEGETMELTEDNFKICRKKCLEAYVGQEFDIPDGHSNRLLKLMGKIKRKSIWRKLIS
jgi:hypothetical protein